MDRSTSRGWMLWSLALALELGCQPRASSDPAPAEPRVEWIELALSSPAHLDHWDMLALVLTDQGIESMEGPASLGTASLMIHAADLRAARAAALELIEAKSLTIRLHKDAGSDDFEVFVRGRKTGEESYVISHEDQTTLGR